MFIFYRIMTISVDKTELFLGPRAKKAKDSFVDNESEQKVRNRSRGGDAKVSQMQMEAYFGSEGQRV